MFTLGKVEEVGLAFTSQEENERELSNDALIEELKVKTDMYANEINNFIEELESIVPHAKLDTLVMQIISLLLDPTVGVNDIYTGGYSNIVSGDIMKEYINKMYSKKLEKGTVDGKTCLGMHKTATLETNTLRIAKMDDMVKVIATLPWMKETFESDIDAWKFSAELIIKLEDIFFHLVYVPASIEYKVFQDDLDDWIYYPNGTIEQAYLPSSSTIYTKENEEYAKVSRWKMFVLFDFKQSTTDGLSSKIDISHFPMICTPNDWKENVAGGYLTPIHSKPTKKRGASKQPQNVLDVLNALQNNSFVLADHIDIRKYSEYITTKLEPKYEHLSIPESDLKIKGVLRSATAGFEYITQWYAQPSGKKVPFYFEFQYDFRGRVYSTGFNINLQADTYKKAMILPAESNFDRSQYTIEVSNPKGL